MKWSGMARVNDGSQRFTSHPAHLYPKVEWALCLPLLPIRREHCRPWSVYRPTHFMFRWGYQAELPRWTVRIAAIETRLHYRDWNWLLWSYTCTGWRAKSSATSVRKKIKVDPWSVETNRRTDGRTDAADCFIWPANVVVSTVSTIVLYRLGSSLARVVTSNNSKVNSQNDVHVVGYCAWCCKRFWQNGLGLS